MNSRERLYTIISGGKADRTGFWLGHPDQATWPILHRHFNTSTGEELRRKLGDDFRWISTSYCHPQKKPFLHIPKTAHGDAGPFASCVDPRDVDSFDWPHPDFVDYEGALKLLRSAGDYYRAGGMWTCFYHNVMDLFGMENYMVKMYEDPEVVQAVTDKICGFYYEANRRFFEYAGNELDGFFFGNDFGTQLDLICGLPQFDQFIMPWFRKFTDLAHSYNKQVILHSCGAIHRSIPLLIEAGVNCLHPLQAKAANMDAATLARDFKGKIAFMGGIDTQHLLIHGTPGEIEAEVRRVRSLLGPALIVSPSHEAVLPDVPPANVEAMARAATSA